MKLDINFFWRVMEGLEALEIEHSGGLLDCRLVIKQFLCFLTQ